MYPHDKKKYMLTCLFLALAHEVPEVRIHLLFVFFKIFMQCPTEKNIQKALQNKCLYQLSRLY